MRTIVGWLVCAALLLLPRQGLACTIPVYRYALENWRLDAYELVVFHRGALDKDVQDELTRWPGQANLEVITVDVDGKVPARLQPLWERHGDPARLPWAVLRPPNAGAKDPPTWAGPCTKESLAAVLDSPARRRIIERLSRGDTAVLVLLESGDAQADAAAGRLLAEEVQRLAKGVKLPEQSPEGPQMRLPLPLQVRFEVLPLNRDQEGEGPFVQMLLRSETGLEDVKGPILLPVFGRGRLLGSLFGKDLTAEQVGDVARFLCQACSCTVKEQNPGMDLLVAADWDALFDRIMAEDVAQTPPTPDQKAAPSPAAPAVPPVVATARPVVQEAEVEPARRSWLWAATAVAGGLFVVTGVWAFLVRKG